MLLDVTVVPRSSYFSRPRRDSSLLLVKAEILVIQMFVYTCSETGSRWGGLHHTAVGQSFSGLLSLWNLE